MKSARICTIFKWMQLKCLFFFMCTFSVCNFLFECTSVPATTTMSNTLNLCFFCLDRKGSRVYTAKCGDKLQQTDGNEFTLSIEYRVVHITILFFSLNFSFERTLICATFFSAVECSLIPFYAIRAINSVGSFQIAIIYQLAVFFIVRFSFVVSNTFFFFFCDAPSSFIVCLLQAWLFLRNCCGLI